MAGRRSRRSTSWRRSPRTSGRSTSDQWAVDSGPYLAGEATPRPYSEKPRLPSRGVPLARPLHCRLPTAHCLPLLRRRNSMSVQSAVLRPTRYRDMTARHKEWVLGYAMLVPAFFFIIGLVAYPAAWAVYLSFTDKVIGQPE